MSVFIFMFGRLVCRLRLVLVGGLFFIIISGFMLFMVDSCLLWFILIRLKLISRGRE